MGATLAELAERFHCRVRGNPDLTIHGVASIETAGADKIAFVSNRAALNRHTDTRAGALILAESLAEHYDGNALITENPRLCFAKITEFFYPLPVIEPGVHPSAVIDSKASVSKSASVGPQAVIGRGAVINEGCYIGAGCTIGDNAVIGEQSRLLAHVVVCHDCVVGERCILHPASVIGSDGFGYAQDGSKWLRIPQIGRAILGDWVDIGANTCIDRGTLGDTIIGNGVKLDNMVHIAHNVQIGEDTAMAAYAGIAGSTKIGKRCTIGGQAGIDGHLEITDDVHITGTSLITKSITRPGVYSSAIKAGPAGEWRKTVARLRTLDDMARRIKDLEQKIKRLLTEQTR